MRKDGARVVDRKTLEAARGAARARWRKPRCGRSNAWCGADRHVQIAGAIPAWRFGRPESQASSWTSAETRWPGIAVGLQHGDAEEPAAIEIRVCAVDARDGWKTDQGQVRCGVERGVRGTAFGSARHPLSRRRCIARGRDEALVRQWLKKEYPEIKTMAQKQGAEIYFGDAAQMRSDRHAGRAWGKKVNRPLLRPRARHGMSLISAISPRAAIN